MALVYVVRFMAAKHSAFTVDVLPIDLLKLFDFVFPDSAAALRCFGVFLIFSGAASIYIVYVLPKIQVRDLFRYSVGGSQEALLNTLDGFASTAAEKLERIKQEQENAAKKVRSADSNGVDSALSETSKTTIQQILKRRGFEAVLRTAAFHTTWAQPLCGLVVLFRGYAHNSDGFVKDCVLWLAGHSLLQWCPSNKLWWILILLLIPILLLIFLYVRSFTTKPWARRAEAFVICGGLGYFYLTLPPALVMILMALEQVGLSFVIIRYIRE